MVAQTEATVGGGSPQPDWRRTTLGDVLTLQRGFDITKKEQRPGSIPVVSSSGIASFHDEARTGGPGVVIGRKGSLGTAYFVEGPFWPHDTTLWVKDFQGNDPYFCFLLLESLPLAGLDAGSSNPTLNRNHAHQLLVAVPPVPEQRRIAAFVKAFDELIAINERRIELLEDLARSLYHEWFVRRHFLGNGPGNAADLPRSGWSKRRLFEIASHVSRGIAPRYSQDGPWTCLNQRCIRDERISFNPARRQERAVADAKRVRYGDVLINSTGIGTLGRVAQIRECIELVTTDSHVTVVRAESDDLRDWLGLSLRARQRELAALGAGSTGQTELSRQSVENLELEVPDSTTLKEFSNTVQPLLDAVPHILRYNDQLATTRDLLLPRLVTGRLDISDVDLGDLLLPESD